APPLPWTRLRGDRGQRRRHRGDGTGERVPGGEEAARGPRRSTMKKHDQALIAMLLDDAPPSPGLARWLETESGQREAAAYRRTLAAFDRVYRETAAVAHPIHYCAVPSPIGRLFVAASEAGLVRVSFGGNEASFVRELRALGAEPVRSEARTAEVVHQLRAYF